MPLPSGAPDTQVIVYAIQRGEYDEHLFELDKAIQRRRAGFDRLGIIQPSRGDFVEIWDDNPPDDVQVPPAIRGMKFQVVGFMNPPNVVGPLRCRVVTPFQTEKRSYDRKDVVKIKRDWVYRVHYAPVRQE
jgi:hypothetical protein